MAAARKKFKPQRAVKADAAKYAAFIKDTLDGTVKPQKLIEVKNGNAPLELEYDELP